MAERQQRKLVFVGWSGSTSRRVAEALRDWTKRVIQGVRPWMSTEDIRKGKRWNSDIADQLRDAAVGIFCITTENLAAPWIHFEAGALAKQVGQANVCPYLFNVKPSDVSGPLAEFQSTEATKDDTRKLVLTINETLEDPLEKGDLEDAFEVWWPKLETALGQIPHPRKEAQVARREDRDLLEEILAVVRDLSRRNDARPGTNDILLREVFRRTQQASTEPMPAPTGTPLSRSREVLREHRRRLAARLPLDGDDEPAAPVTND